MLKTLKSRLQSNKALMLSLINFLLFPYVLGHFDNEIACEFVITKKLPNAFRLIGKNDWHFCNLHENVSVTTPNNHSDMQSFSSDTIKGILQKEFFNHPIRATIVEAFIL